MWSKLATKRGAGKAGVKGRERQAKEREGKARQSKGRWGKASQAKVRQLSLFLVCFLGDELQIKDHQLEGVARARAVRCLTTFSSWSPYTLFISVYTKGCWLSTENRKQKTRECCYLKSSLRESRTRTPQNRKQKTRECRAPFLSATSSFSEKRNQQIKKFQDIYYYCVAVSKAHA